MNIERVDNKINCYVDGELLLVIEELGNNIYKAENRFTKITGEIVPLDDYRTSMTLIENKKKDKRGYWRINKNLANHNLSWLSYILEEYGIIRKSLPIK